MAEGLRRSAQAPIALGQSFSKERSKTRHNAAGAVEVTGAVRITHPFHPRRGEEIELVVRRDQWGDDRVFYRSDLGHLASIPARWTSLVTDDAFVIEADGRAHFRLDDLLELAALVSRLRS